MPDHVHLLIEGLDDHSDMRRFVHRWKQATAFEWKQLTGTSLWQRGYFEHVLRSDEDMCAVARYLLGNPVRAGLVTDVLDYPFVGSLTMSVKDLLYSVG